MKNVFTVILFLSVAFSFGQKNDAPKKVGVPLENLKKEEQINDFKSVDANYEIDSLNIKPEPTEGFTKFYTNLKNKIIVPEFVPSGTYRTIVSFIVETDGSLTSCKVIRETPSSIGLGEEVIRVLKTLPKWKPGSGRTSYMLPVTTMIENEPEPTPKKQ